MDLSGVPPTEHGKEDSRRYLICHEVPTEIIDVPCLWPGYIDDCRERTTSINIMHRRGTNDNCWMSHGRFIARPAISCGPNPVSTVRYSTAWLGDPQNPQTWSVVMLIGSDMRASISPSFHFIIQRMCHDKQLRYL